MNDTELEQLKEQLATTLTDGVHYHELTNSLMNDGAMTPDFPARWSSDVVEEIDKLAALIKQRETRLVAEARIDELNTTFNKWSQRGIGDIAFGQYKHDRTATLKQESESNPNA